MKSYNPHLKPNPAGGQAIAVELKRYLLPVFLTLLMIVLLSVKLSAQGIKEFEPALKAMKASAKSAELTRANHIEDLYNNVQPTAYVDRASVKSTGTNAPVRLEVDAASVARLQESNSAYAGVEMIVIRCSEPDGRAAILDMSKLISFANLKYVVFLCEYQCSVDTISKLIIQDPQKKAEVFYQISIPD